MSNTVRSATVKVGTAFTADAVRAVAAYLPVNYEVVSEDDGVVLIAGRDVAGWTLDGYVLPRLASGLLFGTEVTTVWCDECDDCPVLTEGELCGDCADRQEGPSFERSLWLAAGPNDR